MSLFRYSQFSFRIPLLQNTLKGACYNRNRKNGFSSGSGTSGSGEDSDTGSSCCDPNTCSLYDIRKYGHNLPTNDVKPEFETLAGIPTGVFRCTTGESLSLGVAPADGSCYQNPEYFSFHHMTYYDMHWALRQYRKTCPDTGRKK